MLVEASLACSSSNYSTYYFTVSGWMTNHLFRAVKSFETFCATAIRLNAADRAR